jgi:predicted Zn-ribbon and HTH transcriptional regulator
MQELARKRQQWEEEQTARCRAAYAPLLPPDRALYNAVLAAMRRENAAKHIPDPVCKKCGFPIQEDERDTLFVRRCSTCAGRHVDNLLRRIRRRIGRKAAIRALKRLARGG